MIQFINTNWCVLNDILKPWCRMAEKGVANFFPPTSRYQMNTLRRVFLRSLKLPKSVFSPAISFVFCQLFSSTRWKVKYSLHVPFGKLQNIVPFLYVRMFVRKLRNAKVCDIGNSCWATWSTRLKARRCTVCLHTANLCASSATLTTPPRATGTTCWAAGGLLSF